MPQTINGRRANWLAIATGKPHGGTITVAIHGI